MIARIAGGAAVGASTVMLLLLIFAPTVSWERVAMPLLLGAALLGAVIAPLVRP